MTWIYPFPKRRFCWGFSLLALFFAPSVRADEDSKVPARWAVGLFGRSTDDSLSTSKTVGALLGIDLQKDLSDDVYGHLHALALLEAGSSSSLFTDEFQPNSQLLLVDARLRWDIAAPLQVAGGALEQDYLNDPIFLWAATFPAALVSLHANPSHWSFALNGQAAVATGTELRTKSVGKDSTPELFTGTAIVGWRKNPDYFAEAKATYFSFQGLTHGMAADSRFYGNSVAGVGDSATFLYNYQGVEGGLAGSLPVSSRFAIVGGGNGIQNTSGPVGANRGAYGYAGFTWVAQAFRLHPIAEYYYEEADASAGFFTSKDFGHNNRRGYGGTIQLKLRKPDIELSLRMRNTNLIAAQPFQQDDFRYYDLNIELPYAPL